MRYRSFEDFEREEIFSRTSVDDVLSETAAKTEELDFEPGAGSGRRGRRADSDDE